MQINRTYPQIDEESLVNLTSKLIRFNTEVPPGDYTDISKFLAERLTEIGFDAQIFEAAKGKSNVVALLEGRENRPGLILHGHVDVVPVPEDEIPEWICQPFSGKIIDGRIYGRGAVDMKGPVAAMIMAAEAIQRKGTRLNKNLMVTLTGDEEIGSDNTGAGFITKNGLVQGEMAIVGEPSDLNIALYHKGLTWIRLTTRGMSSHAGYPEKGINAIHHMVKFTSELLRKGLWDKRHDVLGQYTLNIGKIKGGEQINLVPSYCECELDVRTIPGMTCQGILEILDRIGQEIVREEARFTIHPEVIYDRLPAETSAKLPVVTIARKVVERLRGKEPNFIGTVADSDAYHFRNIGIPAIWIGPGEISQGAHGINEYISIDQLVEGSYFFMHAILQVCQSD